MTSVGSTVAWLTEHYFEISTLGYRQDDNGTGVRFSAQVKDFSPMNPDWVWDPTGYCRFFPKR
jgi:hypothetical protein